VYKKEGTGALAAAKRFTLYSSTLFLLFLRMTHTNTPEKGTGRNLFLLYNIKNKKQVIF
jgi:hypothetical protein